MSRFPEHLHSNEIYMTEGLDGRGASINMSVAGCSRTCSTHPTSVVLIICHLHMIFITTLIRNCVISRHRSNVSTAKVVEALYSVLQSGHGSIRTVLQRSVCPWVILSRTGDISAYENWAGDIM